MRPRKGTLKGMKKQKSSMRPMAKGSSKAQKRMVAKSSPNMGGKSLR